MDHSLYSSSLSLKCLEHNGPETCLQRARHTKAFFDQMSTEERVSLFFYDTCRLEFKDKKLNTNNNEFEY